MVTRFTTSRGSVIHVDEAGTGRPALAIHGLGGGAYFFHGVAAHMGDRHRVIAVDLPGTGLSTAAAPYSLQTWVADLGELVQSYVGEPVAIVGHSMGTIIALEASCAWPSWIRGMAFVGGLPEVRPFIRERLTARADAMRASGIVGWGPKVSPGIFSPATLLTKPEVVGLFERLFETLDVTSYLRSLEILLGGAAGSRVPAVRVPCIAISGQDDQYAPPDAVRAFMAHMQASHRIEIIPGAAHMPFFEKPVEFAELLRGFLDVI
ncbi:MAG TPA: alpha/beta hydrolase [Vicinamibacterales bacterium]|nr:alpha/beta hydrolase [Vicinamibacterales bacterium]